ncbi:MAG: RNA polymerase sigma-70 factor [Gemmatimonadaceae bacterium]
MQRGDGAAGPATEERDVAADERPASEAAITELYRRLRKPLVLYAAKILGDADDAQDMVQELFAEIWSAPPVTLPDDGLLFNRLRSRMLNRRRQRRREETLASTVAADREEREEKNVADAALSSDDMIAAVHAVIATLPDERREIFTRSRVDGVATDAIADELGIAPRTVRWHVTEALETIRTKLAEQGFTVPRTLPRGRPKGSRRRIDDV